MKKRINPALGLVAVVLLTACSFLQPVSVESKVPKIGETRNIVMMTAFQVNDQRNDLVECQIGGSVKMIGDTYWIQVGNRYSVIAPTEGDSTTTCSKNKKILVREEELLSAIEAKATQTCIEGTQSAVAEDVFIPKENEGTPTPPAQRR